MPQGGVVIMVDNILISMHEGMPYQHGQFPFVKFEHIPTSTFYADSPLVDLIPLNREYNESRTDIAEAARRMGRPQLVAQRGSIVPSKITNEAGLVIEYKQGTPPPQPMQLTPLPQYVVDQQDRILMDIEDITGQHEVTRGQAPSGITAGTAISYLGERDNQFLTPEYQSVEDGYGKLAEQSLELFIQYVDIPRKIKTIGADMAFDTMQLSGADIKGGTDVRVEPGSAIGQSRAAQNAHVQDMFSLGLIDQTTALRLMEVGGMSKVMDILHVAEKKAQRENIKMKSLKPEQMEEAEQKFQMQQMEQMLANPLGGGMPTDPMAPQGMPADPMAPQGGPAMEGEPTGEPMGMGDPMMAGPPEPPKMPPVIPVDDFDVHEIHIEVHNKFRMSQEYEMLSPELKDQFAQHVDMHEALQMQKVIMDQSMMAPQGGEEMPMGPDAGGGPEDMMAENGQVPDPLSQGGPLG
jgi:hypothetical protein